MVGRVGSSGRGDTIQILQASGRDGVRAGTWHSSITGQVRVGAGFLGYTDDIEGGLGTGKPEE